MSAADTAQALCTHCRLPVVGQGESFCCSGCFVAHHLLGRPTGDEGRRSDGLLARLAVSAFLAMGVMVFSLSLYGIEGRVTDDTAAAIQGIARLGALLLSAPVLFLLGLPLADAVIGLRRWLSADALILVGTGAAWLVSLWNTFTDGPTVYFETATMVLVLVTLGRWLDARARERATARLRVLAEERTLPVARLVAEGEEEVEPSALRVGDRIRLRPGDQVPVDGVVAAGTSFVDRSRLTGEQKPFGVAAGAEVLAGSTLVDGTLVVRATAVSGSRVRDEIDRLLAHALVNRPRLVRLADAFAAGFFPVVLLLAVATGVWHWPGAGGEAALLHALCVVLIACPCALGLATPLAFWCALGDAWRRGILVRDGEVLEGAARVRRAFFDKTGTLTDDDMQLSAVVPEGGVSEDELLALAAALERGSRHPIGVALRSHDVDPTLAVRDFRTLPGRGVEGRIGHELYTLERCDLDEDAPTTDVRLLRSGRPLGRLSFTSRLRPEAQQALRDLRALGLQVSVLTGDGEGPARALAEELGIAAEARLLPGNKAERVRAAVGPTMFVGDGINDAPGLAVANVGVAVQSAASVSLESAPVNLLRRDLRLVPGLVALARRAVRVASLNLIWAFGYNGIGLWLAVQGKLTPVFAASAMVVSSVFVVLNSARLRSGDRSPAVEDNPSPRLKQAAALPG